ncbi:MAG: histidine kinase, partial [Crocinitomicaceae bacterium]
DRKLISDFSENLLQISFEILPNISALGNSKLAYELTGEINVSDTLTVAEQEQISFERLPYGEYVLTLTAINEDGATSKPKKFNLTVNRPYYATWWFRLSILTAAVLITLLIMRLRIKVLQRKNIEKLEKERLKTHALIAELKAIRSQMDPHFIFNCLSSIQSSILNNESEQAYENLTVFTKLLREALLFTSREFISLEEEVGFIEKYVHLEQMRSSSPFDFELKLDQELDISNARIPSLITQPFVENAIRHGLMHKESDKKLVFIVSKVDGGFEVMIKDNGVGIERSKSINAEIRKNHQSTGVKAIHDRIELLNKRGHLIKLKTITSDAGTEVVFTFYHKK